MDIIIIANFTGDFSESDNGRFLYLANKLCRDNDVELITSSFYHIKKKQRDRKGFGWPFKVVFIKEPGYSQNISLKRLQSHYLWGKNVEKYLKTRRKPDVVYCAVPSLTAPNIIARYCERNNIRFVIDVQDLWPEAFRSVVNIPLIDRIIFAPLTSLANGIYKRADVICGVSDTYCKRATKVNKKVREATVVFLGTELETFDRYAAESPILEKKKGEIWLAYCGTLGSSYDITCVLDALAMLNDERIRFIVMGDGPKKDRFENYAKMKKINTEFVGLLPYNNMCSLLAACDIAVNPITHMATQSIINKHADYVASGLPIISTQENEEFRKLIDEFRMGFNCHNSDSVDLAKKIKKLVDDDKLRRQMGINARRCAEEKFDRLDTYSLLEQALLTK